MRTAKGCEMQEERGHKEKKNKSPAPRVRKRIVLSGVKVHENDSAQSIEDFQHFFSHTHTLPHTQTATHRDFEEAPDCPVVALLELQARIVQ